MCYTVFMTKYQNISKAQLNRFLNKENHPRWKGGKPVHICLECKKDFRQYGIRKFCCKECRFKYMTKGFYYIPSRKGCKNTIEHNQKISKNNGKGNLGKKFSKQTRLKMSIAKKKFLSDQTKHNSWKGDDVGYGALHTWVRNQLGRPEVCEHCDTSGLNGRKIDWANKSHKYKRDVTDWLRLCKSCHKKYDLGFLK